MLLAGRGIYNGDDKGVKAGRLRKPAAVSCGEPEAFSKRGEGWRVSISDCFSFP